MDRKSIIVLTLAFITMVLWYPMVNKIWPPKEVPISTNQVDRLTVNVATNETGQPLPPQQAPAEIVPVMAQSIPEVVVPSAEEKVMAVENERIRLLVTSHGGGMKQIELVNYERVPKRGRKKDDVVTDPVVLNDNAPLPVMSILGAADVQGDGVYQLSEMEQGIRASKSLTNGLRLVNEFQLGTNYQIYCTTRLENPGDQPIPLPEIYRVAGTSTPINENDQPLFNGVFWFNGQKETKVNQSWFANRTLGCFPGTPRTLYRGGTNVVWSAVHNQFFTVLVKPEKPAAGLAIQSVTLPVFDRKGKPVEGYQSSLMQPRTTLQPGKAILSHYEIYTGPKEYKRLSRMEHSEALVMDFGGFFGIFSKTLLRSMNAIHAVGFSYGWSIILITIIIKLLFWPLTNASTKSMKRMSKLQPQMKELQEKYKDDPQKMNRKLMEFMKENKVSPLGGCLPMLLQMPVFIGFFFMIKSAIELRGASFLWAWDLSQSDTLFHIGGFPVNPMPILMGVSMFFQARMTPVTPGVDPMQAKMMKYMPMMFVFFLYNFSSGLTLYWTVSNVLTIIQTRITRIADEKKENPRPVKSGGPKPIFSGAKKKRRKS